MDKINVPVWEKCLLTIEEAAAYCGVGRNTLRRFINEQENLTVQVGVKTMVKRLPLSEFINEKVSVL